MAPERKTEGKRKFSVSKEEEYCDPPKGETCPSALHALNKCFFFPFIVCVLRYAMLKILILLAQ